MPRRSYRQYCAFARALDVLGDRWSLLIIRNLLLGPQSWSELRAALPGVAKNLLSERLKHLVADGILTHEAPLYALSDRGRELEPVVFAIADWGERHLMGPPEEGEAMRLRYLMTSLKRRIRPTKGEATLQLKLAGEAFWFRFGADPEVTQGERPAAHVWEPTLGELRQAIFVGGEGLSPEGQLLGEAVGRG